MELTHPIIVHQGSQGRNSRREPEAGTEAETMEQCCLLACSSWLAQSAPSYTILNHFLGNDTAHCGLGLPILIINGENVPTELTIGNDGGIFSTEVASSQMTLAVLSFWRSISICLRDQPQPINPQNRPFLHHGVTGQKGLILYAGCFSQGTCF